MEKIKLVYQGAFAIPDAEEACVVTLTDTQEVRALSIVTDKPMANEIKFHQLDKDVKHPHLVDVLAKMICEQGPQNYHVVFEAREEFAIIVKRNEAVYEVLLELLQFSKKENVKTIAE